MGMTEDEDRIYKDLQYTFNAYSAGEQVYPNWENIYALIVSGFFIVYFTAPGLVFFAKLLLASLGIIFSLNWLRLVSRNYLYARARVQRIRELEKALQEAIPQEKRTTPTGLALFDLMEYQDRFINTQQSRVSKKGTWLIRKRVPQLVLCIWIVLLAYTLVTGDYSWVPLFSHIQ
jgi:hypothetical protein